MALLAAMRALLLWAAALLAGAGAEDVQESLPQLRGLASANPAANVPGSCGSLWPDGLTQRGYTYLDYAGAGATACVFLAKSQDGQQVAVKVSKSKGMANLVGFKRECGDMRILRYEACKKGKELLDLHEAFLPTCLDADEADDIPYIVMHAAPTEALGDVLSTGLQPAARKVIFAQMIAAIYALHGIGMSHNDLHGNNIVLDTSSQPVQLSLIDLGEVVKLEEAQKTAEKRDGNAIWRWTAVLAECDESALWYNNADKMKAALPNFLKCLGDKWQADSELKDAMQMLGQGDIEMDADQRVTPVYRTEFVKSNLPQLKQRYPWSGTDGCFAWQGDKWTDVIYEAVYAGHFKCDTIPTYAADPVKACSTHPSNAACFSIRPGAYWACAGGLDPKVPCITVPLPGGHDNYDGACLMPGHPGYAYALSWEGEAGSPVPSPAPKTVTSTTLLPVDPEVPSSGVADLVLTLIKVVAVIGLGALLFFLYTQAQQARNFQPAAGGSGGGTEMNAR